MFFAELRGLASGIRIALMAAAILGVSSHARGQENPTPADEQDAQRPSVLFFQATVDPAYTAERGGSSKPASGAAITVRPVAGVMQSLPGNIQLTALGGASATRYASTPASDADSLFAMAVLSTTIADNKFSVAILYAQSRDPTFESRVAGTLDTTLSVSRLIELNPGGWKLTPQLKAMNRAADIESLERWALGASLEFSGPLLGGSLSVGAGYDWFDYEAGDRKDGKYSLSSSWVVDLDERVQIGVRAEDRKSVV